MKILREIVTKEKIVDLKGWTIPKGTRLGVVIEGPMHPTLSPHHKNYRVIVVRVDNGTGDWSLCPETAIREEVNYNARSEKKS